MGVRRDGRIRALQMLYGLDLCGDFGDLDVVLAHPIEDGTTAIDPDAWAFAEMLCRGVVGRLAQIDQRITQAANNWLLERMNPVDRAVLRIATYELLAEKTENAVVLDEAIEVARAFGSTESARFVNGVLNAVCQRLPGGDGQG